MKQDDPQFKFRIPVDLKARLDAEAERNTRTLGAEIVARLQASFSQAPQHADLVQLVNAAVDERIGRITASLTLPMGTVQATGGPSTSPAQAPQKRVAPPLKKH